MDDAVGNTCGCIAEGPDFEDVAFDRGLACMLAPALRMLYSTDGIATALFFTNKLVLEFVSDEDAIKPLCRFLAQDKLQHGGYEPLFLEPDADLAAVFYACVESIGFKPVIAAVRGLGCFALGNTLEAAEQAKILFLDAVKIAACAKASGDADLVPDRFATLAARSRESWQRLRSASPANGASGASGRGRLAGRIAIVTGGAQGFGKGIAESLASEGAYIAVADLNFEGAAACASQLNAAHSRQLAIAVAVDVSDEESVEHMVQETVLAFGGLDVLVSNAGVLVAGGLSDMSKEKFDFVTRVNYTGYFLCAKFASEPMKIQNKYAPGYLTDIIEINSKSGLEGSKKNFAYAGSKFGGIGLTQSFALELVEYGIKVNAVCPGNLLDGSLWSDPERGLFRQYLDSGKVAGAKTIDDVRKFYEAKVPMKRGCNITDVARAIIYIIEQKYETGQAVPVTGGQIMLR